MIASEYMWQFLSEILDGEKLPDSLNETINGLCNGTLVVKAVTQEWQGLSDDEIWNIANFLGKNKEWDYPVMFSKTIEKALKEKNT